MLDQSRVGRKRVFRICVTRLRWAFVISVLSAMALPFVFGQWKWLVSLGLLLAIWIVATIVVNLWERVRVTSGQLTTFQKLRTQSRSYYGMQVAHLGVAVFIVGVTLVTGYQIGAGRAHGAGRHCDAPAVTSFRFNGVTNVTGPNYRGRPRGDRRQSQRRRDREDVSGETNYTASGNVMTETAIDSGLFRDLYVSLGEPVGWRRVERACLLQTVRRLDLGWRGVDGARRRPRAQRSTLRPGGTQRTRSTRDSEASGSSRAPSSHPCANPPSSV